MFLIALSHWLVLMMFGQHSFVVPDIWQRGVLSAPPPLKTCRHLAQYFPEKPLIIAGGRGAPEETLFRLDFAELTCHTLMVVFVQVDSVQWREAVCCSGENGIGTWYLQTSSLCPVLLLCELGQVTSALSLSFLNKPDFHILGVVNIGIAAFHLE